MEIFTTKDKPCWSYGSWIYFYYLGFKIFIDIKILNNKMKNKKYQTPRTKSSAYLLTLPLFAGISRVRALSPAWTGSHARETLISHTHLFLPPTKKSSTIKSWPTFCDQYFWKFPIWNSLADEKRREIRMVKVFKWYPVIDLFDTFTGKLGHGD